MKRLICLILLSSLAGLSQEATKQQTHQKTLNQPTEIQGYQCASGATWFYADGHLKECAVARDTAFGVAVAPAGSWINLTQLGKPDFLFLVRDTDVAGYTCRGGNRVLGPTEGAMTGFYPSGKLKSCWLAADREIQGVPCAGSSMFSGKSDVRFSESGKLQACKLAKDYGGLKRGQRFSQVQ
jgi:hypothetical protein